MILLITLPVTLIVKGISAVFTYKRNVETARKSFMQQFGLYFTYVSVLIDARFLVIWVSADQIN